MIQMQQISILQTLTKKKCYIENKSRLINLKVIYNRISKLPQVRPFDGILIYFRLKININTYL